MRNLTTLDYWTNIHGVPDLVLDNEIIEMWIKSNLDRQQIKTSIEIGCYPGKYLTILGAKGVEVNGIDYIPNVVFLDQLFREKGFNVGEFINADFTQYDFKKKYDCVMSFGFIEHFDNWDEMILKHLDLVSEKGFVVIEVPNFRGFFQRLPRMIYDWANYKRHNISSMNLKKWEKILEENDFEIVNSSYFGGYHIWFEKGYSNKNVLKSRAYLVKVLDKIRRKIFPSLKNHKSYSSFVGVIARKR